ncbi:hypothetical protein K432DRAFT_380933 [Lepidopterella palustris CBS 459.81]|uniref:Uncharacterized protein n=1 Tax=Lepidopterella palustris CBS 459.81 TaxID=1314670 RepID=A0A8E2JH56_9PEZI|nr:hypothetical protein K432DRAFT_380933 [Lepidopterella palustris CBS 459.81]
MVAFVVGEAMVVVVSWHLLLLCRLPILVPPAQSLGPRPHQLCSPFNTPLHHRLICRLLRNPPHQPPQSPLRRLTLSPCFEFKRRVVD